MFAKLTIVAGGAIARVLGTAALGLAFAGTASADILPFSWNIAAAGLAGGVISGQSLKATEVSRIHFDPVSPNLWEEHGFAHVTGVVNAGGQTVTPAGLDDAQGYTLYFKFDGAGDQASSRFSWATMTLYGVSGASTFGIDGSNNAYVDNGGNAPVVLATASMILGTTGVDQALNYFADLWSTFTPAPGYAGVFTQPIEFSAFYGHFFHDASQPGGVVPVFGNGFNAPPTDILLNGGDDTLSFVPEPGSLLLLLGALPGWLRFRRRPA